MNNTSNKDMVAASLKLTHLDSLVFKLVFYLSFDNEIMPYLFPILWESTKHTGRLWPSNSMSFEEFMCPFHWPSTTQIIKIHLNKVLFWDFCLFITTLLLKKSESVVIVIVWSYGSWSYNYLCNQFLQPLNLWVRIPFMAKCIRYNIMW